jgi:hypothetical protein
LKQHAVAAAQLLHRVSAHGGDFLAEDLDAAGGGLLGADEVAQQGALAAAAAAHDDEGVPGMHLETHAIEHGLLPEVTDERIDLDDRFAGGRSLSLRKASEEKHGGEDGVGDEDAQQ